jgi:solute carrier family 35 protein F5
MTDSSPTYKGLGAVCLSVVILLWVSSSVLQQQVFDHLHYAKPFLFTYFTCLLFLTYLPTFFVKPPSLPIKQLFKTALQLGPLWFVANVCLSESLVLTSVSSNTVLSSLSGVFSLILSVLFLRNSPDLLKFVAAISAVAGVAMISLADEKESGDSTMFGDLLALVGSIFYACYSVLLKSKKIEADIMLLFGLIGLVNSLLFLPGLLLMDYTAIEPLTVPSLEVFSYFLLASLSCSVILDLLLAVSIRHLSPALCTLSLTLTIPLSFAVEAIYMDMSFSTVYLLGTLLVILGFCIMAVFESEKLSERVSNAGLRKLCIRPLALDT